MSSSHPSGLAAGDRVRFRGPDPDPAVHAPLFPGATKGPPPPLQRNGTLIDDPQGTYVRIQYDDQVGPDSALVESLTRLDQ